MQEQIGLKRVVGPVQLTLFGIGGIIGAGIFATIGTAAAGDLHRPGAGPALIVSFVITGIVCAFTALCYAEFASMIPKAGSAYTYAHASLGELVAWIIGWDLIIEYAVGNIGVAVSWANYFKTLLKEGFQTKWFRIPGFEIADWISMDYRTAAKVPGVLENAPHLFGQPIVFNALAFGIVVLVTLILVMGVRESAWFNAVMVAIKVVVLTFFIVVGSLLIEPNNWTGDFAPNGWRGISAGAAIVFFAYIGFDAVSTVAEETKNPQRDLPIGILASLAICTLFYVLVAAVFTGMIPFSVLQTKLASEQAEPLTMALQYADPDAKWKISIVAFGSVIAHTAVLLVFQLGQPRIFYAMARDGLLPQAFARVHPRFRTPHLATILTGIFVAVFAGFASIDEMVDLTNIGTLFAFVLVCAGVIVLRIKDPARDRPFRVPSGWVWSCLLYLGFGVGVYLFHLRLFWSSLILVIGAIAFAFLRNHIFPALGVASCLYLMYYLPPTSWLRFAAWLNLGFVIYVGFGAVFSRSQGRQLSPNPVAHDARTARLGLHLAALGVAFLLLMRAFDLWLGGVRARDNFVLRAQSQASGALGCSLGGSLQGLTFLSSKTEEPPSNLTEPIWASLVDVFQRGSWFDLPLTLPDIFANEIFWFLLLPLALNAFMLCPIVIRRALRARRAGIPAGGTLVGSGLLAAAVVAYFALIAIHNAGPRAP
jgi:APA family basic amino acid/polyamine antiporter